MRLQTRPVKHLTKTMVLLTWTQTPTLIMSPRMMKEMWSPQLLVRKSMFSNFILILFHIWAFSKIFGQIKEILNRTKIFWTHSKTIWTSRLRYLPPYLTDLFCVPVYFSWKKLQYFFNLSKCYLSKIFHLSKNSLFLTPWSKRKSTV